MSRRRRWRGGRRVGGPRDDLVAVAQLDACHLAAPEAPEGGEGHDRRALPAPGRPVGVSEVGHDLLGGLIHEYDLVAA